MKRSNWGAVVGESFYVVSDAAVTLRGFAEAAAAWFGKTPNLHFLPWDEWKHTVSEDDANITWEHLARSPHHSIAKAKCVLDCQPRYASLQSVREAVEWLVVNEGLLPADELLRRGTVQAATWRRRRLPAPTREGRRMIGRSCWRLGASPRTSAAWLL